MHGPSTFATLDLKALEAAGQVEAVSRRQTRALDETSLSVVLSGYVRVFRHSAYAHDVTLGLGAPGDVIGAGGGLLGRENGRRVEALEAVQLLTVSPEALALHSREQPHVYGTIAAAIGRRTLRLYRRIEEVSRAGAPTRIAAVLSECAEDFGVPVAGGLRLDLPLSQEDLARLAGTTRETCSSVVATLGREGIVTGMRLRGLIVRDPARLAAYGLG